MNPLMKSYPKQVISLILVSLISLPMQAQVIPGRWEKVLTLPGAAAVTVDLKNGDQITGYYEGLSATEFIISIHSGARAVIPREEVETITTLPPVDSTANGALIGGVIGGGFMSAWYYAETSKNRNVDVNLGAVVLMAGLGFAAGAGAGRIVDGALEPKETVVYEASRAR